MQSRGLLAAGAHLVTETSVLGRERVLRHGGLELGEGAMHTECLKTLRYPEEVWSPSLGVEESVSPSGL